MIDFLKKHDWLGHIIEALVMTAFVGGLAYLFFGHVALLVGAAFAIGHFHGREKRDFEISVQMKPPHLQAYLIWKWNADQQTDFWPVVAVLIGILAGVHFHG